jgi:Cys-tRNA(Pro)/Cys-tRNA(Cys) deacylase
VALKTNAMRVLDTRGIEYEVRLYQMGEQDLSAERAALALGMAPEQIFKTLVALGDRTGPLLVLVPAGTEVDLKALAAASGDRRIELAPLRDVEALTGYERGAVTPLAMARSYPVYIDETAELWPQVGISAGAKGMEILLKPRDLIELTLAQRADIARSV